jgi:hypothetical protein
LGPSLLIALSGILCLFFPHELGVKILVWIGALITLFFNRDKLTEKKEKVPKNFRNSKVEEKEQKKFFKK